MVRVLAHGQRAQLLYGKLQRACHCSAEEGDAHARDTVRGEDLGKDDVARGARHRLAVRQGFVGRQTHDLGCNPFDLHGPLSLRLREGVGNHRKVSPASPVRAGSRDIKAKPLVKPSGQNLWSKPLAKTSGRNLWPKPLAKTSGQNLWPKPLAKTSG